MLFYISYNFDFLRWGFGTTPFNEKIVKRLRQIAMHVMSNDEIKLKLKELADEAGISLQHLSYDIKNKFGLTFQELLNYGKCEYAARLLLGTDKRIIDIALNADFPMLNISLKASNSILFSILPSSQNIPCGK
jgi:AraC-like DNA-binding protein